MFCQKCGSENNNDAKFCIKCGYQFNDMTLVSQNKTEKTKEKKKRKKIVLTVIIILLCIFLARCAISYNSPSMSIDSRLDYIEESSRDEAEELTDEYPEWVMANEGKGSADYSVILESFLEAFWTQNPDALEKYIDAGMEYEECPIAPSGESLQELMDSHIEDLKLYGVENVAFNHYFDSQEFDGVECDKVISRLYIIKCADGKEHSCASQIVCHTNETPDGTRWFIGDVTKR